MNFNNVNGQESTKDRNVDIVFCIDATGSMSGVINNLKENAKRFRDELVLELVEAKTNITSLRVKLIAFRDYGQDADAMEESRFFELPKDQTAFEEALNQIDAHGGGDAPENGFEALYYAMKSKWVTGKFDRQIIVLFTDNEALDLKERAGSAGYPADMVDLAGLEDLWSCNGSQAQSSFLRERCKRLVIFAPEGTKYSELVWNKTQFYPVASDEGLKEIDFSQIIKNIVKSATAI